MAASIREIAGGGHSCKADILAAGTLALARLGGQHRLRRRHPWLRAVCAERVRLSRPPIYLGADSPLWALYRGTYSAKDFDTDEEDALRVGKQLAALNVIVDALVHQGIIVKV